MIIYTVKPGDSIDAIARRYGLPANRIIAENELTDPSALVVGQTLVLTQPTAVYTTAIGDTIYQIASRFGITPNQIWRNNPSLGGKDTLVPGQELVISLPPPPYGTIDVNAYAYPNIDRDILRKTLPYLTYLTLFTYGFRPDGSLVEIDDEELIELARTYGVAPIMMLATLGDDGTFSNELASTLLADPNLQTRVIENIQAVLREKRYTGIDVDFEYIPAEYADAYVQFITNLRAALSPDGYKVFVALAPKTSADQPGLLYGGHDYSGLGSAADAVLLMTYEWGYTYGPPLPVAPINRVREVVDYALTEIPAEKINLGIPNYGYDWALPYVRGESRAQSLSNVAAVDLARQRYAAIEFDETAQSPYFRYFVRENGEPIEHIVHFEDARSIDAKLNLINEKNLRGGSIWNIMRYFPQLWLVLNNLFRINRGLE
ncbi:MAG: LysM peptidoglycan-binding domain-containing protein [Clostridia bacterium]|nr:LysM peptidoglycan-binding domain-containing protein [Clostridia bacterium]